MDQELKQAFAAQQKLLNQLAADIAIIKAEVLRGTPPLTDAQKIARTEAAARRLDAKRSPGEK